MYYTHTKFFTAADFAAADGRPTGRRHRSGFILLLLVMAAQAFAQQENMDTIADVHHLPPGSLAPLQPFQPAPFQIFMV